jgi:osmoprotectant transport system substrate-binding protein
VPAFDFVILADDKGFFPNYALTPVVRKETLDKNPKARRALERTLRQARRRDHGEA